MWRTQNGERTLRGAEATLLRESLAMVVDMLEEEIAGYADRWEFGVPLFDCLEARQKLALLANVGHSLLRDTETCPPLNALNEAAIAALYENIEQNVDFEIDSEDVMDEATAWRDQILAIFRDEGDNDLPDVRSIDRSEWDILVESLRDRVLWDDDFNDADRFLDAGPDESRAMKSLLNIADDYYTAIPPDPTDEELREARDRLQTLFCP